MKKRIAGHSGDGAPINTALLLQSCSPQEQTRRSSNWNSVGCYRSWRQHVSRVRTRQRGTNESAERCDPVCCSSQLDGARRLSLLKRIAGPWKKRRLLCLMGCFTKKQIRASTPDIPQVQTSKACPTLFKPQGNICTTPLLL